MENSKQVIQIAKQSALHKFSALMQRMTQTADNNLGEALSKHASPSDYRKLSSARQFLRQDGNELLRQLQELFRDQMERAMRTMYTDLRAGLGNFSAETLTLIDDEAVNRQIEVGHLVDRLRDSCDENLGRLNIIIAQLHGRSEVKERENPFRPYLIARTLHDVLRKMVKEEDVAAILFDYCANSIAQYLPEYYAELCDVFGASGVKAQLVVRPETLKRHQKEQLARQIAANQALGGVGALAGVAGNTMQNALPANLPKNVVPTLQRLLKVMTQQSAAAGAAGIGTQHDRRAPAESTSFQDFVAKLFIDQPDDEQEIPSEPNRQRDIFDGDGAPAGAQATRPNLPAELLAKLNEFQQLAARGRSVKEDIPPLQNQLFSVREQIRQQVSSQPETLSIEVIAVLFEFILGDEQIPEGLRAQIGRLQIPFLKASMLDPSLLRQAEHPSRQLLNRMGSVTVGLATDTAVGQSVAAEIKRIVKKILDEFDQDMAIFSTCLADLDQFMADKLRHEDPNTALSIDAIEEAEKVTALTAGTTTSLRSILLPINIDTRVVNFIMDIWTRVLVRAALRDGTQAAESGTQSDALQSEYINVLPELVWSAQEKQNAQDRNALMRLLPSLVKRLKSGLTMLNLSDAEAKRALDELVAVHTQVLRNADAGAASQKLPTLEELRQAFSSLQVHEEVASSRAVTEPRVEPEIIGQSLAQRGVSANLDLAPDSTFSSRLDDSLLARLHVGTSVEFWNDGVARMGRLIWIGKNQSIFMFRQDVDSKPMVYSVASLSKALREGTLTLIETAPTFERAVESLLLGAVTVQQGKAGV
jgi:hypothetical protein